MSDSRGAGNSPVAIHDDALSPTVVSANSAPASPPFKSTRTVAIIKPHALDHRFDIEHRITEAKFEIVKERQMEFDVETDPETLFELFGDDARSFAEGPVWVYVLERRRAVEVWSALMGHPDPVTARRESPTSLRALYGLSTAQNAVMGSPDVETAEIQIASLFVSSPPFPVSDLPDDYPSDGRGAMTGSLRSVSSSLLASLRRAPAAPASVPAPSTSARSGSRTGSSTTANGTPKKPGFKAREIPPTHTSPSILPRTTRAADLRAGGAPPTPERGPRTPPSKEALQRMFADVPGHKRRESIPVASTQAPAVPPRMTRAASLRIAGAPPPRPVRPKPIISLAQAKAKAAEEARAAAALKEAQARIFADVPGHKRRESIPVVSARPPSVTPRQNRSATLRLAKDTPPPSSYQFRSPVGSSRPSLSRQSSSSQLGPARPASSQGEPRRSVSRTSSVGAAAVSTPPRPRPTSLQAPVVPPRQNRSAMLRAAKMANGA
ncbi:hypothetical protein BC834DRAFT_922713 [Gloeopeniophorella convolvens]|nr:hypothetical protein BC834DRAFT_922713 [Gloeopeniophorella convolvens]